MKVTEQKRVFPNESSRTTELSGGRTVPLRGMEGVWDGTEDLPKIGRKTSRTSLAGLPRGNRVPKRDLAHLTAQLAVMTRAGVDISTALQTLARQSRQPAMRQILLGIHRSVVAGNSFSEALSEYVAIFGPTYIASITAGEASGKMTDVLSQLAQLQRSELRRDSTLRGLLAYPLVLTVVSSFVLCGLVLLVLPRFAEVFAQFETPLPILTRCLVAVAAEVRARAWLWLPMISLIVVAAWWWRKSGHLRRLTDRLLLQVVLVRDVTRALLIGRICRLLGIMIDSGVPLLESLRLAKTTVSNAYYHELFVKMEQDVLNGRGLGTALLESGFVPDTAAEMMITAEQTGTLGMVTQLIGEHFEEEGETRLRELITILEPTLTIAMGLAVAVVVMAVLFPIFDLTTFAQQTY